MKNIAITMTSTGTAHSIGSRGEVGRIVLPVTENKLIYDIGKCRDPHTREGRVSLLIVLTTGILEREEGVSESVEEGWFVHANFVWTDVLTKVK